MQRGRNSLVTLLWNNFPAYAEINIIFISWVLVTNIYFFRTGLKNNWICLSNPINQCSSISLSSFENNISPCMTNRIYTTVKIFQTNKDDWDLFLRRHENLFSVLNSHCCVIQIHFINQSKRNILLYKKMCVCIAFHHLKILFCSITYPRVMSYWTIFLRLCVCVLDAQLLS